MWNIEEISEEPSDPIGGASGDHRFFKVRFLGKCDGEKWPFTVANEVVATFIGQCLGLNLPAVFPYRTEDGKEFALIRWHEFVPSTAADLARFFSENHSEVHGAIVFDLYVANNDRAFLPKRRNLELGRDGRLVLFDQGNACFYRDRKFFEKKGNRKLNICSGIPRLEAVARDLNEMNDMASFGNAYFQFLTDWKLIEDWCEKVRSLPDFLIESAVNRVPANFARPTPEERAKLVEFLKQRRHYLADHIDKCRATMFPKLPARASHA